MTNAHVGYPGEITACIGNGRNDEAMMNAAALTIGVVGKDGAAATTLMAADIIAPDIVSALEMRADISSGQTRDTRFAPLHGC